MNITYRVSLRLALIISLLISLWSVFFYVAMVNEINDEADDSLENYTSLLVTRILSGQDIPQGGDGSNNTFTITPVDSIYAATHSHYRYEDVDVYIPEYREYEPARVLTTIFSNGQGQFFELRVATPTFERRDLFGSVLLWVVLLYVSLLVTILSITMLVFHRGLSPLRSLLGWLKEYTPGREIKPLPQDSKHNEFADLYDTLYNAMERSESLVARQSQFIGDASHELQTPLAIIGNRVEWLLDSGDLTEQQAVELHKIATTISRAVRLNKTLLLLTKIENGQFPEISQVDLIPLLRDHVESCDEIYSAHELHVSLNLPEEFIVEMNESLLSTLLANLVKNLYLHSPQGGRGDIYIEGRTLYIVNDGESELDSDRLFDRFYHASKRKTSTGLGLALVASICKNYGFDISYQYLDGRHHFVLKF